MIMIGSGRGDGRVEAGRERLKKNVSRGQHFRRKPGQETATREVNAEKLTKRRENSRNSFLPRDNIIATQSVRTMAVDEKHGRGRRS